MCCGSRCHLRLQILTVAFDAGEANAGQLLAAAQGKHIGQPKGLDPECLGKVKNALEKGLSVAETVELTSISLSSVKHLARIVERADASKMLRLCLMRRMLCMTVRGLPKQLHS